MAADHLTRLRTFGTPFASMNAGIQPGRNHKLLLMLFPCSAAEFIGWDFGRLLDLVKLPCDLSLSLSLIKSLGHKIGASAIFM